MNAGGMLNTCKSNEAFRGLVADGWVTRENLPRGLGQQLETAANTKYAQLWKGFSPPRDELASD